jgi:hypothetical protein
MVMDEQTPSRLTTDGLKISAGGLNSAASGPADK